MSVAIIKTKTEQAFEDAFSGVAASLPGGKDVLKARKTAIAKFTQLGLPNRRLEEWKYTDLRNTLNDALPLITPGGSHTATAEEIRHALGPLAAIDAHLVTLVDGTYRADLSNKADLDGLTISSLGERLNDGDDAAFAHASTDDNGAQSNGADPGARALLALNTAYAGDGWLIEVAPDTQIDKPVIIMNLRAGGTAGWTATRNAIKVGANAGVTIIEAFTGSTDSARNSQTNTALQIEVCAGAKLHHIKCLRESNRVTHLSNCLVSINTDATYNGFLFSQGAGLVRNQVAVAFDGEGASLNLSGAFLARGKEHIDNTIVVDHKVPGCLSRELFKGVLDDHARGVVQGKVIVRPDAQKTDGMQMAQVLMLSPDTEFDSKPELEIYADDVVCGHGSTVAEIDTDLLFYCRSRGIPEPSARALLVQSFIGEALQVIENKAISDALTALVGTWLDQRGT